jgi:hypothetical protein
MSRVVMGPSKIEGRICPRTRVEDGAAIWVFPERSVSGFSSVQETGGDTVPFRENRRNWFLVWFCEGAGTPENRRMTHNHATEWLSYGPRRTDTPAVFVGTRASRNRLS